MPSYPASFRWSCEPAATVVRSLGGVRATARLLGVSAETPSQWNRPAERGGTGGFVPPVYWDRLAAAGIDRKLLESGKKEKRMGGAMSRNKGARFEVQVAKDLRADGHDARKVPLSGADSNYPGDVEVITSAGKWILQCKNIASGGGCLRVLAVLREVAAMRLEIEGAPFYAMRQGQFSSLLRGVTPKTMNLPRLTIPGRMILQHIEGHDALVFHRKQSSEWCAIVREERWGK